MRIVEFTSKDDMLTTYQLIKQMYPSLSLDQYSEELDIMIPNSYKQVVVMEEEEMLGLSGYWFGNKLWCGKYIELDNVFTSKQHRSKGVAEMIFKYLENKAVELGCNLLALDSYTDNFKAHKFFYAQGYIPRGFHFIQILDKDKIR